jgi:hypothetical protein
MTIRETVPHSDEQLVRDDAGPAVAGRRPRRYRALAGAAHAALLTGEKVKARSAARGIRPVGQANGYIVANP